MDELRALGTRDKEIPRWVQVAAGLILGLFTLLCGFAALSLVLAPDKESPALSVASGLGLLFGCFWVFEKCIRLLAGRKNRGGLMAPKTLRVVSLFFLALPVAGLFSGYYPDEGTPRDNSSHL